MEAVTAQTYLSDVLHAVAQSILAPDIILLLVFIAYALFSIGSAIAEVFSERRHFKVAMPQFLAALMAAKEEDIPAVVEASGLLRRQKEALMTVYNYRDLPGDALIALVKRLVNEEESHYDRIVGRDGMAAKVAPMLGLMGTLIPLGPGVQALGQADTAALSASLLVAFDTTVAGLVTAAICLVVGKIRNTWYSDYLSALDASMATMLEKIEDMRDPNRIMGNAEERMADLIFATTGVAPAVAQAAIDEAQAKEAAAEVAAQEAEVSPAGEVAPVEAPVAPAFAEEAPVVPVPAVAPVAPEPDIASAVTALEEPAEWASKLDFSRAVKTEPEVPAIPEVPAVSEAPVAPEPEPLPESNIWSAPAEPVAPTFESVSTPAPAPESEPARSSWFSRFSKQEPKVEAAPEPEPEPEAVVEPAEPELAPTFVPEPEFAPAVETEAAPEPVAEAIEEAATPAETLREQVLFDIPQVQAAEEVVADAVEAGNKPEDIDLAAYLELCSTDNGCRIAYTHINGDPDEVFTLTITVRKRHTDRDFTQFDFVGTSDEFIEYVSKPVYDHNEYYDRIMIMSDKADEYYS